MGGIKKRVVMKLLSFLNADIDQVSDGGNGLLLHDGCGAEQCACRHKENITEGAVAHFVEDITA